MGFSVSTTGLENKEYLKDYAKSILTKSGMNFDYPKSVEKSEIFESVNAINPQLSVIKASTQISINRSLSETLKYLNAHANQKRVKTPVFGELWSVFSANNESSEENPYKGELFDFEIDKNAKNIFAA